MCRIEESVQTLPSGKKETVRELTFPCSKAASGVFCPNPRRIRSLYTGGGEAPGGAASIPPLARTTSSLELGSITINQPAGPGMAPEIVIQFGNEKRTLKKQSSIARPLSIVQQDANNLNPRRPSTPANMEQAPGSTTTHPSSLIEGLGPTSHLVKPLQGDERIAEQLGWQVGRNKFLWNGVLPAATPIVTERGMLGRSAKNEVEEVKMLGFTKVMARKRIFIERARQAATRDRKQIQSEVSNMKSLRHRHIVRVVGCYAEDIGKRQTFCVLMFPAADEDLAHFLYEVCQPVSREHKCWIAKWFTCLASALAYMQSQGVFHEDIKPSNIVHFGERVLFTDFGSSRRLEADQDTSTDTPARASRMFAAPEAMPEDGKLLGHGSKTDVYSLGLVFVEMYAVLLGKDVDQMRDFLFEEKEQGRRYSDVTYKIPGFLGHSNMWDCCLKNMLHPTRQSRPSAQEVVDILKQGQLLGPVRSCSCQNQLSMNVFDGRAARRKPSFGVVNGNEPSPMAHSMVNLHSISKPQLQRARTDASMIRQPRIHQGPPTMLGRRGSPPPVPMSGRDFNDELEESSSESDDSESDQESSQRRFSGMSQYASRKGMRQNHYHHSPVVIPQYAPVNMYALHAPPPAFQPYYNPQQVIGPPVRAPSYPSYAPMQDARPRIPRRSSVSRPIAKRPSKPSQDTKPRSNMKPNSNSKSKSDSPKPVVTITHRGRAPSTDATTLRSVQKRTPTPHGKTHLKGNRSTDVNVSDDDSTDDDDSALSSPRATREAEKKEPESRKPGKMQDATLSPQSTSEDPKKDVEPNLGSEQNQAGAAGADVADMLHDDYVFVAHSLSLG